MSELKFAKTHEWVKVEGTTATIGITDYAQSQLGDVVFIELPEPGSKLAKKSQLGTLESTKAASELYSPLTGEVIEVNKDLINNPQWINESAFDKGWMLKLKIDNPSELDSLMDQVSYEQLIVQES
jgi:glycine cleavage system H protein